MKPDQLIKRRGKLGLIKTNATLTEVKQWITERMGKEIAVSESDIAITKLLQGVAFETCVSTNLKFVMLTWRMRQLI